MIKQTKICNGPKCKGAERPISEFYIRKSKSDGRCGRPISRCRQCVNYHRRSAKGKSEPSGTLPVEDVKFVFQETVKRLGYVGTEKETGVTKTTLENVLSGKQKRVQLKTMKKIYPVFKRIKEDPSSIVPQGIISVSSVRFIFREIVSRVGYAEAARWSGLHWHTFKRIVDGEQKRVKIVTVQRAAAALKELRDNEILLDKKSIRYGAFQRGHPGRKPIRASDFYFPTGDNHAEYKRNRRKEGKP